MFNRISHQQIILPPFLSYPARSFISALLQRNPEQRLGHGGIQEVMHHRFFDGVDWEAVESHRTPLPLAPSFHQSATQSIDSQPDYGIFDRFAHFVDGTNRCFQKHVLKQTLCGWIHYDMDRDILDEQIYGVIPCRGNWKHTSNSGSFSSNGYFQYNNRSELLVHIQNEQALFPELVVSLSQLHLSIEEKTMLFENDRCVCQWRLCGLVCARSVM